ncbi:unnamed protein product [Closterium sp. NIES-65]|nr:unnamed protein product [Closterium sp. NIES-65]CAI5969089.1 unnamed protein product [Closterium sp. NIES-65]
MASVGRARDKQCASKGRQPRGVNVVNNGSAGEVEKAAIIARCLRSGRRQAASNEGKAQEDGKATTGAAQLAPQYSTKLEQEAEVPEPQDFVFRLCESKQPEKFKALTLFNADGAGCFLEASDVVTIVDGQCLTDAIVNFHNVLLSIRRPTTPNGTTWVAIDSKAFAHVSDFNKPYSMGKSARVFDVDYLAIPVFKNVRLGVQKHQLKRQDNEYDCDVFVCHYLKVLVDTDFRNVKLFLYLEGVSALEFRRGMRGDICMHADHELVPALVKQGLVVPKQPQPKVTVDGAMLDSRREDVNTKLTMYQVELYGLKRDIVIWKAAFSALGSVMGYSDDQLLAAAAHVLQTQSLQGGLPAHGSSISTAPSTPKPTAGVRPSASDSPGSKGDSDAGMETACAVHETFELGVVHQGPVKLAMPAARKRRLTTPSVSDAEADVPSGERRGKRQTATSQYKGVRKEKRGKWSATILFLEADKAKRTQMRLGVYNKELEAATAYAAAVYVVKAGKRVAGTVELSAPEKCMLQGCTLSAVRHLVKGRQWFRWTEWETALADCPEEDTGGDGDAHSESQDNDKDDV